MAIIDSLEVREYLAVSGQTVPDAALTLIDKLIPRVESLVRDFLRFNPESATRDEYYPQETLNNYLDGDPLVGGYDLIGGLAVPRIRGDRVLSAFGLRNLPVRSITEVRENAAAWMTGAADGNFPDTHIISASNYQLDVDKSGLSWTGILRRVSGSWVTAPRGVKVTYVSGLSAAEFEGEYSSIKHAIIVAVLEWIGAIKYRANAALGGGIVTNLSIRDFSVTFDPRFLQGYELSDGVKKMLSPFVNVGELFA